MEDLKQSKQELRKAIEKKLKTLSAKEIRKKCKLIEDRLFAFANFLEAETTLFYLNRPNEVDTRQILEKCRQASKGIVLPLFNADNNGVKLYKVYDMQADLKTGPNNILMPDPDRCKLLDIKDIDIAIIPGIAFDEKGGRIGDGTGRYDRLIPELPITARKVALSLEEQMTPAVPMEAHDRYVDIIITDQRIIYKI